LNLSLIRLFHFMKLMFLNSLFFQLLFCFFQHLFQYYEIYQIFHCWNCRHLSQNVNFASLLDQLSCNHFTILTATEFFSWN
jgi:hypothetical protein